MTDASPASPALAADFPAPDADRWRALVDKALAGAPFEKLNAKTYDGIALKPLYTEADWASAADAAGAPGAAPFTRGPHAARDPFQPWDARQIVSRADPAAANREALADLEGGVSSIEFRIDQGDGRGVVLKSEGDVAALLADIMLDLAPVALDAGGDPAPARLIAAFAAKKGVKDARLALNLDPVGAALRTGGEAKLADAIAFVKELRTELPRATLLRVDARPAHEAGGSEAQELGLMLASAAEYLRAGDAAGLAPEDVSAAILATLAVGPDLHIELAKVRAARALWARMLEACGVAPDKRGVLLQAVTGKRMMTRRDAWVNMLRVTAAGFSAGVGGADIVTTLPLTEALGQPTPFARRIARNTQILLMEESNLGRVADPAGGAWAIEKLTDDLARAGWAFFQEIEKQGGALKAFASGWLAAEIAKVRQARLKNIARRKDPITGVSEFPLLDEKAVAADPWPAPAPKRSGLIEMRLAEGFEALRDAADAAKNPPVFLATLGTLPQFSARAMFAKNAFEAGGLRALGAEDAHGDDSATLIAAFKASGAVIACLCSSDALYAERGEDAARALKAAGCARLYLAGRGGDKEAALKEAGVDGFVFAGADIIATLADAHKALGIG